MGTVVGGPVALSPLKNRKKWKMGPLKWQETHIGGTPIFHEKPWLWEEGLNERTLDDVIFFVVVRNHWSLTYIHWCFEKSFGWCEFVLLESCCYFIVVCKGAQIRMDGYRDIAEYMFIYITYSRTKSMPPVILFNTHIPYATTRWFFFEWPGVFYAWDDLKVQKNSEVVMLLEIGGSPTKA